MTFVGVFALVTGLAIVGLWVALLSTGRVEEVERGDRAIWFHVAAEVLLGVSLAVAGASLLLQGPETWITVLGAASLGGATYSAINSSGYYAGRAEWTPVLGLGLVAVLAVIALIVLVS